MSNLDKVIHSLKKTYGNSIIKKGSELPKWKMLSTGLARLDYDLGGGIVLGQTTEIAGASNVGKTALASFLVGRVQKLDPDIPIFYYDIDKKFDPDRARLFGVNPDNIIIVRGELTAENVFEMVRDTIRAVKAGKDKETGDSRAVFIVDSLAAMVSEALFETSANYQYGGSSRQVNQATRVWEILCDYNQIIVEIQELRQNLNPMGEKKMMPGGEGQSYVANNILWLTPGDTLKNTGNEVIGHEIQWTNKKTKAGHPKERGKINFYYETGFDVETSLVDTALELELLEQKGGGYFVFPDGSQVRGKDKFIEKLKLDKEFMASLETLVYNKIETIEHPLWKGEIYKDDENVISKE